MGFFPMVLSNSINKVCINSKITALKYKDFPSLGSQASPTAGIQ